MNAIFAAPKLKIKRANQHVDELNRMLADFLHSDFCRLHIEKQPNTGAHLLKFEQTKAMPGEVPLIIGDAIHNLRSALDIMACDIVSMAGGVPSKYTNFPVRDTRKELVNTLNGGEIKIAGADIIDLITDTIKPYKGGNDPLCALHSLDIIDKHRLLIPIASVTALTNVNVRAGNATFTRCTFAVGEGGVVNIAVLGPSPGGDFQMEGYGTPAFDVCFKEGQPFKGQSVIPTLHQLSQLVAGVVQTFEQAYLARS